MSTTTSRIKVEEVVRLSASLDTSFEGYRAPIASNPTPNGGSLYSNMRSMLMAKKGKQIVKDADSTSQSAFNVRTKNKKLRSLQPQNFPPILSPINSPSFKSTFGHNLTALACFLRATGSKIRISRRARSRLVDTVSQA
jgi:hypothetical protein